MFRRREDSLFDNETDSKNEAVESATVVSPSASSPTATSASSYTQPMPRPPVAPSQPQASAPQQASSFRPTPSSPITSDMGRNRMPDVTAKPASAMPSSAGMPSPSSNSSFPSPSVDKTVKSGAPPRRVLTVGHDILLKGEIATCDRLLIEGKVEATLNDVHTVEITEQGSFRGSANIEDAEIRGLFEGDLVVRNRLVVYSTGKVRGKITYGEIEIERGGEMTGEIKTNASAASGVAVPRARVNKDDKVAA
jgi:cytoskeletal protein CcmA (bactofilin family)